MISFYKFFMVLKYLHLTFFFVIMINPCSFKSLRSLNKAFAQCFYYKKIIKEIIFSKKNFKGTFPKCSF